jgi:GNAT superfamily N-acetyltransferase
MQFRGLRRPRRQHRDLSGVVYRAWAIRRARRELSARYDRTHVRLEAAAAGTSEPEDRPFRSKREHARCLNRHDLRVAGCSSGVHRGLRLSTHTCELCWSLGLARSTWFTVDQHEVTLPNQITARGRDRPVVLVARPPAVRAGVGRIELRIRGVVFGWVDVQLCGIERRGVLVRVEVIEQQRRRGVGSVLIDAAFARGPGYTWSMRPLLDTAEVRAFWASLDLPEPVQPGKPFYCSHMLRANGEWP